jgi:hypothetical protein
MTPEKVTPAGETWSESRVVNQKISIPWSCNAGHDATATYTWGQLRIAFLTRDLSFYCEECQKSYAVDALALSYIEALVAAMPGQTAR